VCAHTNLPFMVFRQITKGLARSTLPPRFGLGSNPKVLARRGHPLPGIERTSAHPVGSFG
jgi:hypothetical protein